jgi:hypothetical protein
MCATYRREYENFTHLPGESIDALFQRFMVVVNNMRANVDVLPYDDHDRVVKLLHSLDRTVWGRKFQERRILAQLIMLNRTYGGAKIKFSFV